jgi:hypothetical protein
VRLRQRSSGEASVHVQCFTLGLQKFVSITRFPHPLTASASASALLRVARAGPRRRLARLAVQRRRRSKPSAVKVAPEGNEASRCRVAAVRRLPRRPKLLANGARSRPDGLHQIGCIHSLTPCQTTHPRSIPSASGQSTQKALAYLDECCTVTKGVKNSAISSCYFKK